jgi:hypothetical protein
MICPNVRLVFSPSRLKMDFQDTLLRGRILHGVPALAGQRVRETQRTRGMVRFRRLRAGNRC